MNSEGSERLLGGRVQCLSDFYFFEVLMLNFLKEFRLS